MKTFENYFNQENIIAPGRQARPMIDATNGDCPFCLENKDSLEKIIAERWQGQELIARIVANKYPATHALGTRGKHDVVIDTAHHKEHPKDFSSNHWEALLVVMQERWQQLAQDTDIRFIQIFKNYGALAGASISHSHWQILALAEVPRLVIKQYETYHGGATCYLCQMQQRQEGWLVGEDKNWLLWVPPVPAYPYEVWLVPKKHCQHYGQLSIEEIKGLGSLLKYLLKAYDALEAGRAFNICFMSGDLQGRWPYHFHIKLVMRIGQIAGFEIATGCHILSVSPADYALALKKKLKGMYEWKHT